MDFFVANDLRSLDTMASLLADELILGQRPYNVSVSSGGISVDGSVVQVVGGNGPGALPWGDLRIDVVIETAELIASADPCEQHLDAGAPCVVLPAPCAATDLTVVVGVNDDRFDTRTHRVVSNASSATNCVLPMIKVLDDSFGVIRGMMTVARPYAADQSIIDSAQRDLRRRVVATIGFNSVRTAVNRTTDLVLRSMKGGFNEATLRASEPGGLLVDLTVLVEGEPPVDEVNAAISAASHEGPLADVIAYTERPIVSADIARSSASCTFEAGVTTTLGSMVKVTGWYDGGWGHSSRLVDLARIVGAAASR